MVCGLLAAFSLSVPVDDHRWRRKRKAETERERENTEREGERRNQLAREWGDGDSHGAPRPCPFRPLCGQGRCAVALLPLCTVVRIAAAHSQPQPHYCVPGSLSVTGPAWFFLEEFFNLSPRLPPADSVFLHLAADLALVAPLQTLAQWLIYVAVLR